MCVPKGILPSVLLKNLEIPNTPFSYNKTIAYKKLWVKKFVPIWDQDLAVEYGCLPNGNTQGYLWHAFSFHLLDALEAEDAHNAFRKTQLGEAFLVSSEENTYFHLPSAAALTVENLDECSDFVLTSADFRWTYAKPYPYYLNDYFYTKK